MSSSRWEPINGSGKSYSWPDFKWYQFMQKRRWRKAMSKISAGPRIKL